MEKIRVSISFLTWRDDATIVLQQPFIFPSCIEFRKTIDSRHILPIYYQPTKFQLHKSSFFLNFVFTEKSQSLSSIYKDRGKNTNITIIIDVDIILYNFQVL